MKITRREFIAGNLIASSTYEVTSAWAGVLYFASRRGQVANAASAV